MSPSPRASRTHKESKSGKPEQPKRISNECSAVGDPPCKPAFCTNLSCTTSLRTAPTERR